MDRRDSSQSEGVPRRAGEWRDPHRLALHVRRQQPLHRVPPTDLSRFGRGNGRVPASAISDSADSSTGTRRMPAMRSPVSRSLRIRPASKCSRSSIRRSPTGFLPNTASKPVQLSKTSSSKSATKTTSKTKGIVLPPAGSKIFEPAVTGAQRRRSRYPVRGRRTTDVDMRDFDFGRPDEGHRQGENSLATGDEEELSSWRAARRKASGCVAPTGAVFADR